MASDNPDMRRFLAFLLVVFGGVPLFAQSIFTYAGGGSVDGRPATTAALHQIQEIATDTQGNLYIADTVNHRIRKVFLPTGVITTIAGSGTRGYSGDGGDAKLATMFEPRDVAADARGNVFVSDVMNHRIRRVDASTGLIATVAGIGQFGFSGDGGPATAARLLLTESIAVDSSGNLFISDGSNRIRKVASATGIITTYAGGRSGFDGDGGPATAAALDKPRGMATAADGSLYLADYVNNRIRRILPSGMISTVAGNGTFSSTGDGGPATLASLHGPSFVDVDSAGNLYIGEVNGGHIRKVTASTGIITTIAGKCCKSEDGIPATDAHLVLEGVAVDLERNVYVIDRAPVPFPDSRIRKIDATTGMISTVAGVGYTGVVFNGDGGPATSAVLFLEGFSQLDSGGLALDGSGNLHIADYSGNRVRKVAREGGQITTIAGTWPSGSMLDNVPATTAAIGSPGPIAFDAAGNLFVSEGYSIRRIDVGTGLIKRYAGNRAPGFSGDGGPATLAAIGNVRAIALDAAGNLFIGAGSRIRKVAAATGVISTVSGSDPGFAGDGGPAYAARFSEVTALTIDSGGHLFVADSGNNYRIRRIDGATGIITTVAGNGRFAYSGDGVPATASAIWRVSGMGTDSIGNLYLADQTQKRVRKVDAVTKIITTIAGTGAGGIFGDYAGDHGPATRANFSNPYSLAVDPEGTIFVSDSESNRVRVSYACVTITPPQLLSPANHSSGLSGFPKLSWRAVRGAFRYDVLVDTVNPPKNIVASNITTTSFSPANLDALTTYYWQIIAKGDPYCTPTSNASSEIRSFTTSAECGPPSPP